MGGEGRCRVGEYGRGSTTVKKLERKCKDSEGRGKERGIGISEWR